MSENYKIYLKEDSEDLEPLDLSGYSNEDFIEVFVENFRPWIKKTHGDEVGKYPMSYLVKKYLEDFDEDYKLETRFGYGNALDKLVRVGRSLVEKRIKELPNMGKGFKFSERFARAINHFVESYDLPDFITFKIEERSPFNVYAYLEADFVPTMKYDGNLNHVKAFPREFRHFVNNYLGLEQGSPAHGKIQLNVGDPRFIGTEEWVKGYFNKVFKKEIKQLTGVSNYLHSVKISFSSNQLVADIILIFRRYTSWSNEHNVVNIIEEYLREQGYNTDRLRVRKN